MGSLQSNICITQKLNSIVLTNRQNTIKMYLHFKLDEKSAFEPKYENADWNKICEYLKTLTLAKFQHSYFVRMSFTS